MRRLLVGVLAFCSAAQAVAENACPVERIFRTPRYRRGNANVLLQDHIDRARWIRHPEQAAVPAFWRFERTFDWDGTPLEIDVSADERFVLLLDGREIARGPNRGTVENWMYQSYRLMPEAGSHCLAAVVWQAGEHAPNAQTTNGGGFVLKASGKADKLLTTGAAAWQVGRLVGTRFTGKSSVGGTVAVAGTGMLAERPAVFCAAVPVRTRGLHDSLYGIRTGGWMLFPSELPDQLDDCKAVSGSLTVPAHSKEVLLRDLGDYYCAYPELRCSGGKGAKVSWGWAESLFEPGGLRKGDRNKSEGKEFIGVTDVFLPDGRSDACFTVPWWRAGRWVRLEIETADEPLAIASAGIVESRYPLRDEGAFACDDPAWPVIEQMCLRGIQMCDHEMLMDCPYYEQQMYGGDTRVQLNVLSTLSADDRMIRRAIELFELARRDDGMVPMNWPTTILQESSTFTLCHLLMYGDYARWHRNLGWLRARAPGMRHGLYALADYEDGEGLLVNLPGWRFVDWVPAWNDIGGAPGDPRAPNAIENLFWILALRSAAETERALGDPDMADYWVKKANRTSAAIRKRFWDAKRGMMADDLTHAHFSEHTQALALLGADLAEPDAQKVLASLEDWKDAARCSVYFRFYLFEAFFKHGRGDLFLKRLDLWHDFVRDGLKTPLESPSLDGIRDARSDCHAWGSHPVCFARTGLAGVRPDAPGFTRVRVAPAPGPLQKISAVVPHPDGRIAVDFTFAGDAVRGSVETPVPGVFAWHGAEVPLVPGKNAIGDLQVKEK